MCFYTDRNLHDLIFNWFILVPMLWKYHEASPYSDAYIYGSIGMIWKESGSGNSSFIAHSFHLLTNSLYNEMDFIVFSPSQKFF